MNTPFTDVAAEHALFNTKSRQKIQQTEFMTSAPTFKLCPPDMGLEVAFAGRSNAGKSSAINALTNQRQLARSSKTPGRTQMINFFSIGDTDRRLVDLPGYGYAAVPLEMKKEWQVELEEYLVSRSSLAGSDRSSQSPSHHRRPHLHHALLRLRLLQWFQLFPTSNIIAARDT